MASRLRTHIALILSCVLLALAASWFASLKQGEDLLIQRRYAEAAQALEQALAQAPEGQRDRILLLLGRARLLGGDADGAVQAFRRLVSEEPGSPLLRQARFQEAKALEERGDDREAAQIYRDEIERLIGLPRKEEIAATYLSLAEKALGQEEPDHQRAVTFFDLALDLGLPPATARTVRLKAAESQLAQNALADAVRRFEPLVEELDVGQGKLRAMLGLGRSKRQAGDRAGARAVLRDLRDLKPESAESADAAYEIALSYGVPTPSPAELDRAVGALEELANDHAAHPKAKIADFLAARCYRHVGRTEDALESLRSFVEEQADEGLDEIADARAMIGDVLAEQQRLEEAIVAWREYLSAHPAHGDWERVQRAIVNAEFAMAHAHYQEEQWEEARQALTEFAQAHPLDSRNPQIFYLLGDMLRQEKKFEQAREAFARCVSKYPGKNASSHAQFAIGEIYEEDTFNYRAALEAYRKVTWGPWVQEARKRIAALTRKHLHLFTERVYRTDEEAVFEITSRNIESVRVRVFRLDLEDYFRATHTAGEVERLDIEVIEPDSTFESTVPDYQEHQETTRKVAIGFSDPGAYVVKVDDRELEATTMVLVSDLALIAKSSRHEFFVFTQDTRLDRVAPGVHVVLSDGTKVIAEGTTGTDGVWSYEGEELKNHEDLRVFAVAPSGSGAGSLDLSGLGYTPGLTPKGYLFTDRPAYQPGQEVHVKGIVREVQDGQYRLPQADDYRVSITSAGGRLMFQRRVAFTDFGTFAVDLTLPAAAELGEWRIQVTRADSSEQTFHGSFQVARYERPRLQLTAEPERPVVYRGEEIEGRFTLRYFFGEPAVGKEVEYFMLLPDGGQVRRTGTTNAAGEVGFSFSTEEFAEEAFARIQARVPAEGVATALVVPVVTAEFVPTLSTVRPVYLAGERFQAEVKFIDRSGKPLSREGTAILLRLEQSGAGKRQRRPARQAEVEVARETFTTDADGVATVAFRAEKGGPHRIRIEAVDRFGNPVSAAIPVTISGDDDDVKLRLLADRDSYEVGDTVRVLVANRAGERLVLETVQGDGILDYRSRVLPAGESVLEVPLRALHAPNFGLALAMVDGNHLHTAERGFRVDRAMELQVEMPATARPGEEVEVSVTARDPQGRPLVAEVALSLVDQALLDLYGDRVPAISPFFYGQLRETSFRTTSSCTWSYEGTAKRMSEALLAEERRMDLERLKEEAEKARRAAERPEELAAAAEPQADAIRLGVRGGGAPAPGGPATAGPSGPQRRFRGQQAQSGADDFFMGQGRDRASNLAGGRNVQFASDEWNANWQAQLGYKSFGRVVLDLNGFGAVGDETAPSNEPRSDFSETGAWISSLVTGEDGKGTATVTLPDSTTAWKLKARGVTAATDVGEGEAQSRTRVELQASLRVPTVLVEGDRTRVGAEVHNLTEEELRLLLELVTARGDEKITRDHRLTVPAHAQGEHLFELLASGAQDLVLTLTASGGEHRDAVEIPITVQPFGMEFRDGRSGKTNQVGRARLGLPVGREYTSLSMVVEVGPDPGRDLIAASLGIGYRPRNCIVVDVTNLARASRGLSALYVLDYVERSGGGSPADSSRLLGVVQASVTALLSAQRDDGSLSWVGQRSQDLRSTCQALRLFGKAWMRGIAAAESGRNKAAEWLLLRLPTAPTGERPDILWALAEVGRARFESLNSLHRVRHDLSVDGMARLALAWQAFGRQELAGEVLEVLRPRLSPQTFDSLPVEAVAHSARALLQADRRDTLGSQAVEFLQEERRGVSWGTPAATAAALSALTLAQSTAAGPARTAEVTVTVNGTTLATLPPDSLGSNSQFEVPTGWLKERGNEVEVRVAGGAEVHWSVNLIGFAAGFRAEDRNTGLVNIDRDYLADFLRHDNELVPAGFSVLEGRDIETFENHITGLQAGHVGRVRTRFWLQNEKTREEMPPLVVEEPIPNGCTVPPDTVKGSYDHLEMLPDRMVFYYREGVTADTVQYELHARFPGVYRALPTRVYGALRPDLLAHGTPGELTVHPRGSETADEYRLTPDELYHLGKALFDEGQKTEGELRRQLLDRAHGHLQKLLDDWHKEDHFLRERYFKEVARMMLFLSIERGESRAVVRFFEQLKDRYPDLVIPFDKILEVGKAYIDIGEFEAALLVFRATAEASFLKEAAVATTLEQQGEIKESVQFLHRLLRAYPDLNTMRVSLYSIGQKLAALAAGLSPDQPVNPKVGSARELRNEALDAFREFLVVYPEDPLAEEVSFAWATTHVEGRNVEAALETSEAALQRYPDSTFEDEFLYTVGYAQFVLGEHEAAFDALRKVAEEDFTRDRGGRGPSENRYHAIYLMGQIHHARGEPAKALELYERVEDRFTDAGEAADYFLRKSLSLPEVATFPLEKQPTLEVTYRNVASVEVQIFRVDLMRLYLLEKSLNDISGILLHGIKPLQDFEVELGSGRDYRSMEKNIRLDLAEPGAYLVVARGSGRIASGMVLRTDLEIETQESFDVGQIRVNVKRGDAFLGDAHVKVIGSGDQRFRSGDTDLRGVFVANELVGMATVIVKKDDQYAFYRGEGIHQPEQYRPQPVQTPRAEKMEDKSKELRKNAKKFEAYEQNLLQNDANRARQLQWLQDEVLNKQQKGVEVYRTK